MENITVLYKIKDKDDDFFNATTIKLPIDKEVYLIDILVHFSTIQGLGTSHTFYVQPTIDHVNGVSKFELISLKAPSSVVPVNNKQIILVLERSFNPPIVPYNQLLLFQKLSKKEIYQCVNDDDYVSNNNFLPYTDNIQKVDINKVNVSTANPPPKPPQPFRKSSSISSQNKNDSNPTSPQETNVSIKPNKNMKPYMHSPNQNNNSPSSNSTSNSGIDLTDVFSKQTADKMKKSFLSFAQTSLQKVTEVVENVTSTVNSSTNSSTGGMSYSTAPIRIGKYNISIVKELAEGGFGVVYLVNDLNMSNSNGPLVNYYALKKMLIQSKEQQSEAQTELQALKLFTGVNKHPNIIELLDSTVIGSTSSTSGKNTREMLLLFNFYAYGSVWDSISKASPHDHHSATAWPYTEPQAIFIITGIAYALSAIHDKGYAHRDVKPHNILIGDDGTPILTDLGSMSVSKVEIRNRKEALMLEDDASIHISAPYRCPELTEVPQTSFPVIIDARIDVWALGCTMYCIAFGRSPFETAREGVQKLAILNGRYTTPPGQIMRNSVFSDSYCTTIKKMLTVDHSTRPSIKEVILMLSELEALASS